MKRKREWYCYTYKGPLWFVFQVSLSSPDEEDYFNKQWCFHLNILGFEININTYLEEKDL